MSVIDVTKETLIPLREVPRRLPIRVNGKRLHISAVYRWVTRGIGGVRLETTKIGGTTYCSEEALQRFADRQANPSQTAQDVPGNSARARELERVSNAVRRELGLPASDAGGKPS